MLVLVIADDDSLICLRPSIKVDLLISLGDLHDNAIQRAVAHYRPEKVFAVRGNHDTDAPFPSGIQDLHCTFLKFGGLKFGGFEGSWRYKPRGHHLFEQQEVSAMMRGYPAVDVFVTHNSPAGIHERDTDVHQGFRGFTDYIERMKPRLMIHGHQHVDAQSRVGETPVIGVFGETLLRIE